MITDHFILIINICCIAFLIVMLAVLAAATRMKGGAGWAAMIIVTTTVPAYLIPFALTLNPEQFLWFLYPTITLNVLCIPSLWFFVRSQLDKEFRISWRTLIHLIPSIISLVVNVIYYSLISFEQIAEDMKLMQAGYDNLPTVINNILVFIQVLVYFPLMIWYIRRRKKYLQNNFSDSDYFAIRWILGFIAVSFGLFVAIMITYIIFPRNSAWINPILNVICMAYLVYVVIFHSTNAYINRLPETPTDTGKRESIISLPTMSFEQMKEICDKITDWLLSTEAYKNSDLTLSTISFETGIHHKNISAAINGYLHKNFFELVNGMRVEEAKRLLLKLSASDYTIESIYTGCGFRSRSTFFMTFKKFEGVSPAQWLKRI